MLNDISNELNVPYKVAKKLMLRLCFFGTFRGFCEENGLTETIDREPVFVESFTKELAEIARATKIKNPVLFEMARKKKKRMRKEMETQSVRFTHTSCKNMSSE